QHHVAGSGRAGGAVRHHAGRFSVPHRATLSAGPAYREPAHAAASPWAVTVPSVRRRSPSLWGCDGGISLGALANGCTVRAAPGSVVPRDAGGGPPGRGGCVPRTACRSQLN